MYPILFEFGFLTVYSQWFFITLGFIASCLLFGYLLKRNRITASLITDNALGLALWAIAMGRIAFIIAHYSLYAPTSWFPNILSIINLSDKGISFWGVAAGFASGMWYYQKKSLDPLHRILDMIVPSVTLGLAFGSFGAFLEGANYGMPTSLPWGVEFLSAEVKYILPLHPTQIYSMIYNLLITILLIRMYRHAKTHRMDGFVAESGLLLYSTFRFLEDFVRGDDVFEVFGLRLTQIGAFLGIIVALYLLHIRYTNKKGGDPDLILQQRIHSLIKRR